MSISRSWITFLMVLILALALFGSAFMASEVEATVSMRGSDTLLDIMQICAESFHEEEPTIAIALSGGGSGVGINSLINGLIDVAFSSRAIKASEVAFAEKAGFTPMGFKFALDGIAVIVNERNPIDRLSMEELRAAFNGTYTSWNQVGGEDRKIIAYGRQSTSGTYAFFRDVILEGRDYRPDLQQMLGSSAIIDAVGADRGGIGYVGVGYLKHATGVKVLELSRDADGPAFSPLDGDAVYSGDYPLARFLYLYTAGTPCGAVATWIGWLLSERGQAIVEEAGFYPLAPELIEEERAKLAPIP